jgi:hypothetical protein
MLALLLLCGCAHTIQVSVPPSPALPGIPPQVSVVMGPRECRDVATALVQALSEDGAFTIDPHAEIQLEVVECSDAILPPTVEVVLSADQDRRRVQIEGTAHAVMGVRVAGAIEAHLIGAARRQSQGSWGQTDVMALSRGVLRDLDRSVASDLAEQLRPIPRIVSRRVYPNAPEDSAHGWFTRAVDAERAGNLEDALRFAELAHRRHPTQRTAAYCDELDRRVAMLHADPSPGMLSRTSP